MHKKVPQKSTTKKVPKRVHKKVQKIVHGLLKVPKKGPKKVLFLNIVPKIALLKALFGDQNLYAGLPLHTNITFELITSLHFSNLIWL